MLVVRRTVRGLGLTPAQFAELAASTQHQLLLATNPAAVAAMTPPPPTGAIDSMAAPLPGTSHCPCLVQVYAQRSAANLATQNMMAEACASDPAGFQQEAFAAGVTMGDVNNCAAGITSSTEWYKKPATWIIGGAIVLTGAFVIKAAL